jgi:hypothetical protein
LACQLKLPPVLLSLSQSIIFGWRPAPAGA